jgi:hypothetical protein
VVREPAKVATDCGGGVLMGRPSGCLPGATGLNDKPGFGRGDDRTVDGSEVRARNASAWS